MRRRAAAALRRLVVVSAKPQHVKIDLNEKLDPKQKIIQTFDIDAQGFRKTRNGNPPTQDIEITS